MKKLNLISICFSFVIVIFIPSCEAPRDNPLDPLNPENNLASIEGWVKALGFPNLAVKNAEVIWKNNLTTVLTDNNGNYSFVNIEKADGWLIFRSDLYSDDSLFVQWGAEKKKSLETFLNAKPIADSIQIYSIVQNRFQFTQLYELFVAVKLSDEDGANDIDSVFIESQVFNTKQVLQFNSETGFYERKFDLSELNVTFIDETIGKGFDFVVEDLDGRYFKVGSSNVKRIIREEVKLLSPLNNEIVNQPVFLNWERFFPGFDFNYKVEVFTNQSPAELVWQKENISSSEISVLTDSSLTSGDYFWVIWAIDEFLNRSRSKPATFRIE
ncbi:MAG: hypothetical protein IPH11_07675 [Ignavibacteriales bacterium]|nr:hypothetical protein [Ignavibacteriales bacterium]